MREVEGTLSVSLQVAVPQRRAWFGLAAVLLLFLFFCSAILVAETSPLDHSKPTASVAPPSKVSSPKALDTKDAKGSDPAACPPSAGAANNGHGSPAGTKEGDRQDASSTGAGDLSVKLPAHEQLEKDEIRIPADVQPDKDKDTEGLQVGLKDRDKDKDKDEEYAPANAAGSPAQCTLPDATQPAPEAPDPH